MRSPSFRYNTKLYIHLYIAIIVLLTTIIIQTTYALVPGPAPLTGRRLYPPAGNTIVGNGAPAPYISQNDPLLEGPYNILINHVNAFIDGWMLSGSTRNHAIYDGIITHNRTNMNSSSTYINGTVQVNNQLTTQSRTFGSGNITRGDHTIVGGASLPPWFESFIIQRNPNIPSTITPYFWNVGGHMHIKRGALRSLTGGNILHGGHLAQKISGGGVIENAAYIESKLLFGFLPVTIRKDINNTIAATGGQLSQWPKDATIANGFANNYDDIIIASGSTLPIGIDSALQMHDFQINTVSKRLAYNPCNNDTVTYSFIQGATQDGKLRCQTFDHVPLPDWRTGAIKFDLGPVLISP